MFEKKAKVSGDKRQKRARESRVKEKWIFHSSVKCESPNWRMFINWLLN